MLITEQIQGRTYTFNTYDYNDACEYYIEYLFLNPEFYFLKLKKWLKMTKNEKREKWEDKLLHKKWTIIDEQMKERTKKCYMKKLSYKWCIRNDSEMTSTWSLVSQTATPYVSLWNPFP